MQSVMQKIRYRFSRREFSDFELINKAIYWAKKYHGNQKRKSGELYYTHPLEVAYMISEHKLKTDVIVASILHDIIEDTEVTAGMIIDNFSWRIAEMVDRLTRDRPNGTKLSVEDILNVERELGKLREEIEATEGRLNYLSNQVSFSTLSVSFYKKVFNETSFFGKIGESFTNGFDNFKSFLLFIVTVWPFVMIIPICYFLIKKCSVYVVFIIILIKH